MLKYLTGKHAVLCNLDTKGIEFTFISPLNCEIAIHNMVFYSFKMDIARKDLEKHQMQTLVLMNH